MVVVGIICPPLALVEIELIDWSKSGVAMGHGTLGTYGSDRPMMVCAAAGCFSETSDQNAAGSTVVKT
jgi:hypothetical protein